MKEEKTFCMIIDWGENKGDIKPPQLSYFATDKNGTEVKTPYIITIRLSSLDKEPNLDKDYYFVGNKKIKDMSGNCCNFPFYAHNKIHKEYSKKLFGEEE
jgi:hypothetical protein